LRSLGALRQRVAVRRSGYLDRQNVDEGGVEREQWESTRSGGDGGRARVEGLEEGRENEDGWSGQEHEARCRTRGDCLGVTDTPVCERFHGQRLWSPYINYSRENNRVVTYL